MNRIRKMIMAILLAVLMVFAMMACGEEKEPESTRTVVEIGMATKGYGSEYAYALCDVYNAMQDKVEVKVVKVTSDSSYQDNQLNLGPSKNKKDIFITLINSVFSTQNKAQGYHWADLSDIYDSVAEGYIESDGQKKIKDILDPEFVSNFTYKDGKQYSLPVTSGVIGLLYNKTKWDATNKNLKDAGKEELVLPKTTDEMFALFEKIKTVEVKQASDGAYAFSYSGIDSYMHFLFNSLWPQYLGKTASENFFEGKDENGVYSAEIYRSIGREYAFEVIRKMIMKSSGYVSTEDINKQYDQEQLAFMRGSAFFSCNGDWLEREVSKKNYKPGEADVEMIRTPVMSKIVKNEACKAFFTGTDKENDIKLSQVITFIDEHYIDGNETPSEADAASLGLDLKALEYIQHARLVRHTLPDFLVVVPEYSEEIEEAKDFIRFMYSKEGQDIILQNTYGCAAPLTIDYSQMDFYSTATYYSKSRLSMIQKSVPYGNAFNYPMEYLGGISIYPAGRIQSAFGGDSPMSARALLLEEYNKYADTWLEIMAQAGVSN